MQARQDGGPLRGGAPRVIWFSSESDPRIVSARSVAADLMREDRPPHLVWNPASGEVVQLIPVTRAARLIGTPAAREGRACVQIMVVGHAADPFTGAVLTGLDPIMRWLDAWGVTRRWPAGPPLPSPQSYHGPRDRRAWSRGGHFGASQVPTADRPDPGAIDVRRITGPDTPAAPIPKPFRTPPQPTGPPQTVTQLTVPPPRGADAPDPAPPVQSIRSVAPVPEPASIRS
ncbi:hypothetical protein [Spirillospora sp. CA-294931]|uniref:hypothetical protein n=1 Tax=Spirillospora sp. CA-294931 TaxID=3240042 RepID=UPI003D9350B4